MQASEQRKMQQEQELNLVKYVIHSRSEGQTDLDGDVGAFWSNKDGWGSLETADRFTTHERMDRFLPISSGGDSEWMLYEEALDLTRKLSQSQQIGPVSATLQLTVTTRAEGATPETIRATVRNLIDAGLADATATLENGEGDLDGAQFATDLNIGAPHVVGEPIDLKAVLDEIAQCLDGLSPEITPASIEDNYIAKALYLAEVHSGKRAAFSADSPAKANDQSASRFEM